MTGGSLKSSSSVVVSLADTVTGSRPKRTTSSQQVVAFGTGSGRGSLFVSRNRPLAAGANETLDLYTGTDLLDPFNLTTPFRIIRYIEVAIVTGGDTAGLRIGGAAANCWVCYFDDISDKYKIFPGGPSFRGGSPAGVAVGSATKNLKVENLGAVALTYDIVIAGHNESAGYATGVLGLLTYP